MFVWIQKRQRGNRHDLHSKTASGEMPGTECRSIHDVLSTSTKLLTQLVVMGLWEIIAKFGCPSRFIAVVRQFHDGMQARVQNDGEFSEPFEVTNWVKQNCVMAPTLFSLMFSAMFMNVSQDSDTGFPIRYHFDDNIFNLRRLQAKTKVQTDVLDKLLYADYMDKNASSEAKMQRAMDQVSQSCDKYDLTISTRRQRLYTNQHLENQVMNRSSLSVDKN